MNRIFRALGARLRALFLTELALDLETQFTSRQAERKAELLRKAQQYHEQGLNDLADELRGHAADLSASRSLNEALPSLSELAAGEDELPRLEESSPQDRETVPQRGGKAARKKVRA